MAISQYGNEYYGLSGDDKPLGTPLNGRKFTEMDTSKEYRFDAENQQWLQQSGGGGGSSTLSGLTDVDISNPTDGQTLVYNATSGKWENGAGGGGSAIPIFTLTQTSQTGGTATCNMTFDSIVAAIQSGTLTVAKFVHNEGEGYQYAPLSYYAPAFDEEPGVVVFVGCELQEGGDIMWDGITMVPQGISYTIRRTISYPGN